MLASCLTSLLGTGQFRIRYLFLGAARWEGVTYIIGKFACVGNFRI